jgi:N6-adenosine-specific RNA methylase IME4
MTEPHHESRMKYRTIVADPPWPISWSTPAERVNGRGERHKNYKRTLGYRTMPVEDIKALPVADLAAKDAHLYLWLTPGLHRKGVGVEVAASWGFSVIGEIIWAKRNFGLGWFPRPGHEPLLVCRRGRLTFARRDVHSVQTWDHPRALDGSKIHSAKPDAALDLVESASPGPYLELFARRQRLGWDTWGNEALEHVELSA